MSLKAFHLLFISLSIVLAVAFGMWSLDAYSESGRAADLATGLLSFAGAAALGVYEARFLRRMRRIRA